MTCPVTNNQDVSIIIRPYIPIVSEFGDPASYKPDAQDLVIMVTTGNRYVLKVEL